MIGKRIGKMMRTYLGSFEEEHLGDVTYTAEDDRQGDARENVGIVSLARNVGRAVYGDRLEGGATGKDALALQ